jgi:hypothetical protein
MVRDRSTALPIGGAEISLTSVAEFLPASRWDWDEIDRGWWAAATQLATSSLAGGYELAEHPVGHSDWGSVIWISRPGYLALPATLPTGATLPSEAEAWLARIPHHGASEDVANAGGCKEGDRGHRRRP